MNDFIKVLHVIPVNDEKAHTEQLTIMPVLMGGNYCICHCEPKEEISNDVLIVKHQSFDGREGVEWVNEILSSRE